MAAARTISALKIAGVAAGAGGIIILHSIGVLGPIETVWRWAFSPLAVAAQEARNQIFNQDELSQKNKNQLIDMLDQLQQDNQALTVENATLRDQLAQTELLQEQRDFLAEQAYTTIQAKVTSRLSATISPQLTINRGSNNGVQAGAAVISGNGVLIGTIQGVDQTSASVLLLNSIDSRVHAVVQNDAHSQGIVQGDFNVLLQMNFLPQFDQVGPGQTIVTSGSDQAIPAGLVIGTIESVQSTPGDLFQHAVVTAATTAQISIVSIVVL